VNQPVTGVLVRLESVPSTQDLIHQLAGDGAPHGSAVVAAEQTAGRGSRGQRWQSPAGGLWLSVLCRPADELALEVLSLRAALLVAGAIERVAPGIRFGIKWPNDLQIGTLKAGGILCEARWQGAVPAWVAVGVGLNISNAVPEELHAQATALCAHGAGVGPEHLVQPVVRAVAEAGQRRGGLTGAELDDFRARDVLLGKAMRGLVASFRSGTPMARSRGSEADR
jgi:biotin-[acetyl-CoA-carboxylase] ligase BirA-like protein